MWKTLRREIWTHTTSLTPPPCIEVPVGSQEIERSDTCVLKMSIVESLYDLSI